MAFNGTVHLRPLQRSFCCLVWASDCCRYRPERAEWGLVQNALSFNVFCLGRVPCMMYVKSWWVFCIFFLLLLKQQDNWQRACFALFVLLHDSYVHYLCVHASSWFYRLFFNLYSAAIGHHIMTRAHILKLLGSGASLDECPLSLLPLVRRI